MEHIDFNTIYERAFKRLLLQCTGNRNVRIEMHLLRKLIIEELWYEYGYSTVKLAKVTGIHRKTITTDREFPLLRDWQKYLLRYGTTDFDTRFEKETKEFNNGN